MQFLPEFTPNPDGAGVTFVGTCEAIGSKHHEPQSTDPALEAGYANFEELKDLSWPPRGGDHEERSLLLQSGRFLEGVEPTEEQVDGAIKDFEQYYPKTRVPKWTETFESEGVVPYGVFIQTVNNINPKASPGYPWGLLVNEKGRFCEEDLRTVYECVNVRLRNYLSVGSVSDGPLKAITLVREGLVDPVRLFIKNEPHSREKVDSGRLRLVSSVSMIDELIERLLFGPQNEAEIKEWKTCLSKPGMGLSQDSQAASLFENAAPHLKRGKKSDVSGWDWCFKSWLYDADLKMRARLNNGFGTVWHTLAKCRFECMKWTLFATSSGRVFAQMKPGIMLSGSYLTSSTNSRGRVLLARLCGAIWAIAMGDDCNEDNEATPIEMEVVYRKYGFRIRDVAACDEDSFEFCSHTIMSDKAIPLNFPKGLFRLLSKEPSLLNYVQFLNEYRHRPDDLVRVRSFLLSLPDWCREISVLNEEEQ